MEDPKIKIALVAEREVTITGEAGTTTRRIPTDTIEPGAIVFYTLHILNEGKAPASNVVVNNPIPEGGVYVSGSAGGANSIVSVSVDHGETFKPEMAGVLPESITDLRWHLNTIAGKESRQLYFQINATSRETTGLRRLWTALYLWLLSALPR